MGYEDRKTINSTGTLERGDPLRITFFCFYTLQFVRQHVLDHIILTVVFKNNSELIWMFKKSF